MAGGVGSAKIIGGLALYRRVSWGVGLIRRLRLRRRVLVMWWEMLVLLVVMLRRLWLRRGWWLSIMVLHWRVWLWVMMATLALRVRVVGAVGGSGSGGSHRRGKVVDRARRIRRVWTRRRRVYCARRRCDRRRQRRRRRMRVRVRRR
jgi:hypothetical protein